MTTHKPSLVSLADNILEVTFRAQKTNIKQINTAKALEIIEKQSANN